jgi:hypothetical protein
MFKTSPIVGLFLGTAITGCAIADNPQSSVSSSSAVGQTASVHSEGSLSGENGRMSVGGDIVEIRRGEVLVNGVSYGRVSSNARVRYTVQGQKRQLFVDGEERQPHR